MQNLVSLSKVVRLGEQPASDVERQVANALCQKPATLVSTDINKLVGYLNLVADLNAGQRITATEIIKSSIYPVSIMGKIVRIRIEGSKIILI